MAIVSRRRFLVIMSLHLFCKAATAETHTVGGAAGWAIPSSRTFYNEWAANETFAVGDKLTFVFTNGHNVYQVNAVDAGNCDGTNPIAMFDGANMTITLTEEGEVYYICKNRHCDLGMTMFLFVSNGSAPSTPTAVPPLLATVSPPAPPASKSAAPEVRSAGTMFVGCLFAVAAAALAL
ncbi:hypothetical protein R1flu_005549 [Riccia fluitans]|uniref:Phytocyanin domain-containing protein n=1 Tax=Riccia fluitans TaxID=41844 RepID=A0ABD1YTG7_9MARC